MDRLCRNVLAVTGAEAFQESVFGAFSLSVLVKYSANNPTVSEETPLFFEMAEAVFWADVSTIRPFFPRVDAASVTKTILQSASRIEKGFFRMNVGFVE